MNLQLTRKHGGWWARAILLLLILLLLLIFSAVFQVSAQSSTGQITDDQVNEIAKELYCPVCESTPLDVCPTQACADWREVIRTKLAEGQTEEEIKEYFTIQYGPRALAQPPTEGFTLAVWILPIVAILVGGLLFGLYMKRIQTAKESSVQTTVEPSPESPPQTHDSYESRIEQELKEN